MSNILNQFFETYGLRARFEPLERPNISVENLASVLEAIEEKLGIDPEEQEAQDE